jgi:pimeloyl-ACP methyl ester carboxylesterase
MAMRARHVGQAVLALAGGYLGLLVVTRRQQHWGATDQEAVRPLPGDDLIPAAKLGWTHGITIGAPAEQVWPWLAQMGYEGRAGMYSYDFFERRLGTRNIDRLNPDMAPLVAGDRMPFAPGLPMTVAVADPPHALVLWLVVSEGKVVDPGTPPGDDYYVWSWAFVLQPVDAETTRLLTRMRVGYRHVAKWAPFFKLLIEPAHLVMGRRQLLGIRQRAEAAPDKVYLAQGDLSGFRSLGGARRYLRAYEQVLARWPVAHQELEVPTPFGATHVIVSGPEAAPPLVLLHATGTSSTGWLLNVGALSQRYRVYAVDILGEPGKTRQARLLRDRADGASWVLAVLDGLGLDRVRLAGWSFGGWLTLNFVLAAPHRVERAVLLAPFASLAPYRLGVFVFLKVGPYLPLGPPGRLTLRLMAPGFQFDEQFARQFALGGRYFRYANPRRSVFPTPYPDEELAAVSVPILLLVGDKEQTFNPRRALANATRLVPDLQAELLAGAGHLLAMDKAQQVTQRMLQFLSPQGRTV